MPISTWNSNCAGYNNVEQSLKVMILDIPAWIFNEQSSFWLQKCEPVIAFHVYHMIELFNALFLQCCIPLNTEKGSAGTCRDNITELTETIFIETYHNVRILSQTN